MFPYCGIQLTRKKRQAVNNNTPTLYGKIISDPQKLTWKEILSTGKQKRSGSDLDYAMIAGTSLDTVQSETGMLQKWQKPWLYRRVALTGGVMSFFLLAAVLVPTMLIGYSPLPAMNLLLIMIPPCVMPLSLMILFWEMNAPRDISLVNMLECFLAGGMLSLLFDVILLLLVPEGTIASLAPVTEEPAKLFAALFFLKRLYRKKGKIYGFTGLAIGAAVGAGFAAFESAQYAYSCLPQAPIMIGDAAATAGVLYLDAASIGNVVINILMRSAFSVCGHVLYCAPYASIAARNIAKSGKFHGSLASLDFWFVFAISCVCHGAWNSMPSWKAQALCFVVITALLWRTALYVIRQDFAQLVAGIPRTASAGALTSLHIQGVCGIHAGVSFSITHPEILIGTDASCKLTYPVGTPDIAPRHAKLLIQGRGLYLADLGSGYGSSVNGIPVKPMTGVLLKSGDRITLGKGQEFVVN